MNEYFLIAKIISVYGKPYTVRDKSSGEYRMEGFVRIFSYSDFPERFFNLEKVYINFFGDKKEFYVEKVVRLKDSFLLKFKNFDTDNDAGILVGREIFVDKENLVTLPENYFFVHDLIGSKVYRNSCLIGVIKDVLNYPANDVYVVENGGKEILIPAVLEFIEQFDPVEKILILKPGDELYENDED